MAGPFPTRDLAFYVCPVAGTGIWRRNVEQLEARWPLFTGKKVVGVATKNPVMCKTARGSELLPLDPPEAVYEAFRFDPSVEFVTFENSSHRREVAGFLPMFERLAPTAGPNRAVFFCHAKGVTYPDRSSLVHRWADMMYSSLLDYWDVVEATLDEAPLAGSFKRVGETLGVPWHYSGTCYWMRSADLFSGNWRYIDPFWWGTESYPGRRWHVSQGGVVFFEFPFPGEDVYSPRFWEGTVDPAWADWKERHEQERTVW